MAAFVEFGDTELEASDYQTSIYAGSGITAQTYSTAGVDGLAGGLGTFSTSNFADARNGTPARFLFLNNSFVYDPSTQGAIQSINALMYHSLDITIAGDPVNLANAERVMRVLAMQDGKIYKAIQFNGLSYSQQFRLVQAVDLEASDFFLFNPADPWGPRGATGLDFAGSAITFGFELTHYDLAPSTRPDTAQVVSRLVADDFFLLLTTDDAVPPTGGGVVPEPSTWAMMILGFGASGAALRARRRGLVPST
ncbi:MAG: PEPxxWA-CTERM sorting domain-containing protein [Phenylobacterium sp.]|nr:PEPxxWA-CTERM sorting domain-containing protein [Phenylobacterium sp.]